MLSPRVNHWLLWGLAGGAGLFGADGPVSFTRDIQPVFESSCWKCHGGAVQLSKLDLRSREAALKGGQRGPAMVPGKAADSRLYRVVAGLEKPNMPLDGKLSAAQISAIKDWIDQGAAWDGVPAGKGPDTATQLSALEDMPIPPEAAVFTSDGPDGKVNSSSVTSSSSPKPNSPSNASGCNP